MKKILIFTLTIAALLGLIKVATIIPFTRMGADDFAFSVTGFQHGVLKAQLFWYLGITGRVTTNFLQTVFGMFSSENGLTGWYTVLTLALLSGSLFIFFKNLFKSKLGFWLTILVSVLFMVSYYLITPDKTESWYWMTGSITYLWPTFLGLGAVGFALADKQNIGNRAGAFLLALLAGSGNETFGVMFLSVLVLLLLYFRLIKSKLFNNFLVVFAGAAISFAVMFFAPGNTNRLAGGGSDEMSLVGTVFYSLQKGPALLFSIVGNNIVYLLSLLTSLSAFFAMQNIAIEATDDKEELLKKLFFILAIPVLMSVLFMLPGYKALGRVPPSRTEVNLAFVVILSLIFGAMYLGQIIGKLNLSKYFTYKASVAIIALVFLLSATNAFTKTVAEDIYIAKNYSVAFDELFSQLKSESMKGNDQVVIVKPLPESGLIHSQKLTNDTTHWANSYWSVFFKLKGIKIEDVEN
jgi:hypothetical protein